MEWIGEDSGNPSEIPEPAGKRKTIDRPSNSPPKPKRSRESKRRSKGKGKGKERAKTESENNNDDINGSTEEIEEMIAERKKGKRGGKQ